MLLLAVTANVQAWQSLTRQNTCKRGPEAVQYEVFQNVRINPDTEVNTKGCTGLHIRAPAWHPVCVHRAKPGG